MRFSNPVFSRVKMEDSIVEQASYKGITLKTTLLFALAIFTALLTINGIASGNPNLLGYLVAAALIGGISVFIGSYFVKLSPTFSIIYALCEGCVLGFISLIMELYVPGIVANAILITFLIFAVTLGLFISGIIRVGNRFRKIMMVASISMLAFFLLALVLSFAFPAIYDNVFGYGQFAYIFSVIFIIYGAFMLIADFDRANMIVEGGCDKKYEWVCALGLMVTIVWIYIEVLRLLAILMKKKD